MWCCAAPSVSKLLDYSNPLYKIIVHVAYNPPCVFPDEDNALTGWLRRRATTMLFVYCELNGSKWWRWTLSSRSCAEITGRGRLKVNWKRLITIKCTHASQIEWEIKSSSATAAKKHQQKGDASSVTQWLTDWLTVELVVRTRSKFVGVCVHFLADIMFTVRSIF